MKLGILILWPVKVVFVLVVRWEFCLLLLQEMSGKTLHVGAWTGLGCLFPCVSVVVSYFLL